MIVPYINLLMYDYDNGNLSAPNIASSSPIKLPSYSPVSGKLRHPLSSPAPVISGTGYLEQI